MMTQTEVRVNASQSNLRILWLPALLCLVLLLAEIYLLVHDWGSLGRSKAQVPSAPIAIYLSGKNNVRQKPVGTLIWEKPETNMPLFRESAIATTDNSEAVLKFDDQSELIVEQNSLVILEEAPSSLKTGNDGKIVARLVRGSMKRKNMGTTPFFVKLSPSKDAPAVQIKDTRGDAVFRILYRVEGYEITVESGSIVVNDKDTVKAGEHLGTGEAPKLPPPVLKKPKVDFVKPHSYIPWNWFIAEAEAAANSKLSIQFSWEPIPEAAGYRIQVSKTPDFTDIFQESDLKETDYTLEMDPPAKKSQLFFRVAGISGTGAIGTFSAVESVDVKPDESHPKSKLSDTLPLFTPAPESSTAPIIEATPAPVAKAIPTPTPVVENKPAPTPEEPAYVSPPFVETGNTAWIWYGVQLASRKFKSSTTNPRETSGSGFNPTVMGFEFQHAREPGTYYSFGGTFSYESEKAELPPPSNTSFSTSTFNLWFTYGARFDGWKHPQTWHFGPYLATSKKITESGLLFGSETIFLAGAMVALQSDPVTLTHGSDLSYRAQIALLAVGTIGADVSGWLRKPFPFFSGVFYGVKANARISGVENAFSGGLELGAEL